MEDWGLALSLPYEKKEINGIIVHIVDKKALVACFAKDLPETVMIEIAKMGPERVVFRDECFKDSVARINAEQFFKHYDPAYRPETMKVL
jgi:adenine-specific DNA-methyltransferase